MVYKSPHIAFKNQTVKSDLLRNFYSRCLQLKLRQASSSLIWLKRTTAATEIVSKIPTAQ